MPRITFLRFFMNYLIHIITPYRMKVLFLMILLLLPLLMDWYLFLRLRNTLIQSLTIPCLELLFIILVKSWFTIKLYATLRILKFFYWVLVLDKCAIIVILSRVIDLSKFNWFIISPTKTRLPLWLMNYVFPWWVRLSGAT